MSKCDNCILQTTGYCWCEGEPEKISGNITSCDYFQNKVSLNYNIGFIDGYLWAINRRSNNNAK